MNINAYLRQENINKKTGESKFVGRLESESSKLNEEELIKQALKWWPVKIREASFRSKGNSSLWKLVLKPLTRSDYIFPEEGVPFSVVLTISDKNKEAPVFNEMRQQLQSSGVEISDIRTALRPRVR